MKGNLKNILLRLVLGLSMVSGTFLITLGTNHPNRPSQPSHPKSRDESRPISKEDHQRPALPNDGLNNVQASSWLGLNEPQNPLGNNPQPSANGDVASGSKTDHYDKNQAPRHPPVVKKSFSPRRHFELTLRSRTPSLIFFIALGGIGLAFSSGKPRKNYKELVEQWKSRPMREKKRKQKDIFNFYEQIAAVDDLNKKMKLAKYFLHNKTYDLYGLYGLYGLDGLDDLDDRDDREDGKISWKDLRELFFKGLGEGKTDEQVLRKRVDVLAFIANQKLLKDSDGFLLTGQCWMDMHKRFLLDDEKTDNHYTNILPLYAVCYTLVYRPGKNLKSSLVRPLINAVEMGAPSSMKVICNFYVEQGVKHAKQRSDMRNAVQKAVEANFECHEFPNALYGIIIEFVFDGAFTELADLEIKLSASENAPKIKVSSFITQLPSLIGITQLPSLIGENHKWALGSKKKLIRRLDRVGKNTPEKKCEHFVLMKKIFERAMNGKKTEVEIFKEVPATSDNDPKDVKNQNNESLHQSGPTHQEL